MNYHKKAKIIFFLLLSITLLSCGSVPLNLQIAKKNVIKYYESSAYSNDLENIISNAEDEINNIKLKTNSVVIFDIDETSLSNYENIKEIYFGYDSLKWDNWINEAKAPAIPEVKKFYDYAISKKIKVVFLSSRKSSQYDATNRNLKHAGYLEFDTLILKDNSVSNQSSSEFKSKKRELLTQKGYEIIADIGDQASDLVGKFTGIQIKLPNYLYIIE